MLAENQHPRRAGSHRSTAMSATEEQKIATPYGEISIKIKRIDGQIARVQPEYEDCLRLAQAAGFR